MGSLSGSGAFRVIADAMWTSAGDAWILNAEPPFLLLQAVPGEFLTSFGQPGDGPDELGFPSATELPSGFRPFGLGKQVLYGA